VPPRQSGTLTEAELRIMNVLWRKGSGTVQQVLDSITEKPVLAYNSVLTTIRILERKGYLKHLKMDGRTCLRRWSGRKRRRARKYGAREPFFQEFAGATRAEPA